MPENAVEIIIVQPKRQDKFLYYVNNNFDNPHYSDSQGLLLILKDLVSNKTIAQIGEGLSYHRYFAIDVTNDTYLEMVGDSVAEILEMKKALMRDNSKEIIKQKIAESKEDRFSLSSVWQSTKEKVSKWNS